MNEEWRDIAEYEGYYQVSNQGRVRSVRNSTSSYYGRILADNYSAHGYLLVWLFKDGVRQVKSVHKLVAETFIGPCPIGQEVHHIDGSRNNNIVTNLQYVTRSENVSIGYESGEHRYRKGEGHEWAVLSEATVLAIRVAYANGEGGYKKLAERFNSNWGTVRNIVKRRRWKHLASV